MKGSKHTANPTRVAIEELQLQDLKKSEAAQSSANGNGNFTY